MTIRDGRARAVVLAIVELPRDSCWRTHQVVRHLRAGVPTASIVRLIHAIHLDQGDATTIPRVSGCWDVSSANANARNAVNGSLARSRSASRLPRQACTDQAQRTDINYKVTKGWNITDAPAECLIF